MTPEKEVEKIKDTELQLIGRLIIATQEKVDSLAISVSRRNAVMAAIDVKVGIALAYKRECDDRLSYVEEWKNTHAGEESGKKKNIVLISTVAGLLIAGASFWYTTIKPTLDKSVGLINKVAFIEQIYQEQTKVNN